MQTGTRMLAHYWQLLHLVRPPRVSHFCVWIRHKTWGTHEIEQWKNKDLHESEKRAGTKTFENVAAMTFEVVSRMSPWVNGSTRQKARVWRCTYRWRTSIAHPEVVFFFYLISFLPEVTNACAFNNGGCTYLCLPTANGGRSCACPDGMDPRICKES